MKLLEFGSPSAPAVLLVHGMGCGGEHSFSETISLMEDKFHVFVPLLDGHDGQKAPFDTISAQANKLANELSLMGVEHFHAALGMSMGGFVCLEMFSKYCLTTEKLILDSGYMNALPYPRFISLAVSFGFHALKKGSDSSLILKAMDSMMGYRFKADDLYPASRETIYKSELACLSYRLPENLNDIRAKSIIYRYGNKEKYMIKGMKTLKSLLPRMEEISMGDVGHGEIMFTDPGAYADRLLQAIS